MSPDDNQEKRDKEMRFTHLTGRSYFSNEITPDALSSPEKIVERAQLLGMTSIGMTDDSSVTGIPLFVAACDKAGIKPIVGAQVNCCDDLSTHDEGQRLSVIALNWDGFEELFKLLSDAHRELSPTGKPRVSYETLIATQNLLFLSGGEKGLFSRDDYLEKAKVFAELEVAADGLPRFYAEIQPHNTQEQHIVNSRVREFVALYPSRLVATQDYRYAEKGDNVSHEILLAVGAKKVWSDFDRPRYQAYDLYIKSGEEMAAAFQQQIKLGILTIDLIVAAIGNTGLIAERSRFKWQKLPVSLPVMSANPEKELMGYCIEAMKAKNLMDKPEYISRLAYEFDAIKKSGFLTYFLVLRDIINWAHKNDIMVGPGRGSSGGSLLCYLIGITRIDPIKHKLLFERFYRPGRIDLPDIDTDFEDERREDVLSYIRRRYGDEYVSGVASYTRLGAKGAIKDVARVFEINHIEVNEATRNVDANASDEEVWEAESVRPFLDKHPVIEEHARALTGWMRGTGQHAAGIVIAGTPLRDRAVIWHRDERNIACWDKRIIEDLGLMKLDVLGLRTLSILRNANENLLKSRGKKLVFDDIPIDDPETLAVFQNGSTSGVFQFESPGMRRLLRSLKVKNFDVVVDANALYRPGPMELIPQYQAVQTEIAPARYAHPLLEPILKDTYGVLIYQEQLMRIFTDMGGFTLAESDGMRKIVAKSLGPDEFAKHQQKFVDGAALKGVSRDTAVAVFNQMVAFGGYCFNRSHAVAYSLIAYWVAYFKAHYPAEFYAAHISNSDEGQTIMAIEDMQRQGIKVLLPDINLSEATKYLVANERTLQAPLSAIKGVGQKAAELIVDARKGLRDHNGLLPLEVRETKTGKQGFDRTFVEKGQFINSKNFTNRIHKRICNVKVQRLLRDAGALPWDMPEFDELVKNRMELLGHIYRELPEVDPGKELVLDEFVKHNLSRILQKTVDLAASKKIEHALPDWGSKPRIMLLFDRVGWKDTKHGCMGNDDQYNVIRRLLHDTKKMTKKDFYITALFKIAEPPLGYDSLQEECEGNLRDEIALLKPPVIIAFGKRPIEFFCGKGARVNDMHGKAILKGSTVILCSKSPYLVYKDDDRAFQNPASAEDFQTLVEALTNLYTPE